ncbi:MAG: uroporphyrinogen decarboxylase family protein [Acidobacteriota bacterium]
MGNRREFLLQLSAFAAQPGARLTPRERVNRVLAGRAPDRPPFSFWHHFHDEDQPGRKHAALTLDFARRYQLDIVKVMSDYPYPKGSGPQWHELKPLDNPFPEQVKALELIRDGLAGQRHFVETVFNPWNQATKVSSRDAVMELMRTRPQALLDALEAIARSEANHARRALEAGASGIFLAVDNAQQGVLTLEEYRRFSEPFDRMVLEAAKDAPLNILHLHGAKVYLDHFWHGWPVQVIHYSAHETGVSMAAARKKTSAVLMGGLDHRSVVGAPAAAVQAMLREARAAAPRWICAPGCSVPDDSRSAHLHELSRLLRASS